MAIVLFSLACLAFLLCAAMFRKPPSYPPGPRWYPFVGCSRTLASACKRHGSQHQAFEVLSRQHRTKLLGLKLGGELVVVALGEENVKHVLNHEHFQGRPRNYFMRLRCLGKQIGITSSDGPLWREHRHFTVKHLKHVGFGKRGMEKEILNELTNIHKVLKDRPKSVILRDVFAPAIMNVLWKFTAGQSIRGDKRLQRLLCLLNARSKAFNMSGGWLNQYPWIRYFAPDASGYTLICSINKELQDIISQAIRMHETEVVQGEDFMYAFLKEMKAEKDTYTKEQLTTVCLDLLIAGSQTTSNTLEFAFLACLRDQGVQERIHEEIRSLVTADLPAWEDHIRMPYTMSFLLEVQRYYTVVPIIGPRRALADTSIGDYRIPKNTTVLLSVHDVHHDHETWPEPYTFRPERFLADDGQLKDAEKLLTFGFGKRRCPGDSLAKRFTFLIFVGVMKKYKIECSNGKLPSCEPTYGIVTSPSPFTADFRERV